jgi:ATP-dependent DNA helicase PIF1
MDKLPDLVVQGILSHLDVESKVSLARASRMLRAQCCDVDPTLLFEFCKADTLAAVQAGRSLFITGPAGTGKTTLLTAIIHAAKRAGRNVTVLTPTHMAKQQFDVEVHTIHSFGRLSHCSSVEQLETRKCVPAIPRTNLLIVDEVSMVSARLLDCLDYQLRRAWDTPRLMGGVQVIFSGDLLQLPPIQGKMIYESAVWQALGLEQVTLTVPLRQARDRRWFHQLQRIRVGESLPSLFAHLRARQSVQEEHLTRQLLDRPVVMLGATNAQVEHVNQLCFDAHPGEPTTHTAHDQFRVRVEDGWQDTQMPHGFNPDVFWRAPRTVQLKPGMRYLCTGNISHQLYNGRLLEYRGGDRFVALANRRLPALDVKLSDLQHRFVFSVGGGVILIRTQFALRMGYAVTVHKSQGMTLPAVVVNMKGMRPNMLYVAFSRVQHRDDVSVLHMPAQFMTPRVHRGALHFYTNPTSTRKRKAAAEDVGETAHHTHTTHPCPDVICLD